QRQPQADFCTGRPANKMAPRQWRKCLDAGKLTVEDGDPVRFTFSGEIATPESLIKWMKRKDMTKEGVIRHLRSPHAFTGSPAAVDALINAFVNAIPVAKASICLRPVPIADDSGKNPTTIPSFDAAIA